MERNKIADIIAYSLLGLIIVNVATSAILNNATNKKLDEFNKNTNINEKK